MNLLTHHKYPPLKNWQADPSVPPAKNILLPRTAVPMLLLAWLNSAVVHVFVMMSKISTLEVKLCASLPPANNILLPAEATATSVSCLRKRSNWYQFCINQWPDDTITIN